MTFSYSGHRRHAAPVATTATLDITPVNDAPTITGDLAISVNKGDSVLLTTEDFRAVDPDNGTQAGDLTFTVTNATNGHVAYANDPDTAITSFTEADLEGLNGADHRVIFVHDVDSTTNQATFTVSVSDGSLASAPTTIVATVPTVTVQVQTPNGFDFESDDPIRKIGSGTVQPGDTTTFTIVNVEANRAFVFVGTGFTYEGDSESGYTVSGGTIFLIHETTVDDTRPARRPERAD